MAKPPRLEHVKYVKAKGKLYAYFNSGQKRNGKAIYTRLPSPASPQFFTAYGRAKAAREKRGAAQYTIATACDGYEASATYKRKAKNTQKLYSYALRLIRDTLGKFPINDLKRADLQLVLDNALPSPSAHNIFLAVLGLAYRHARREGKTGLMPTRDFEKLSGGSHRAWPESVVEAALNSEHDRTRLATQRTKNKRAEMWVKMRAWLKGGAIPDEPGLRDDLIGPLYGFDVNEALQLERKAERSSACLKQDAALLRLRR